uniref:histidine kinase n=1 Tax=uncultured bacterium contig00056 TaxID=1181540 RepID=A0A806KCB7_9BACT|nr:multi-sensor hybrid histidine kinase [uncultured bacterium contig00056]
MAIIKSRSHLFIILGVFFILTVGFILYIVQYQTNSIVTELTLNRVQTANKSLANYLAELEERVKMRAEAISGDKAVVLYIENKDYDSLKRHLYNYSTGMDFTSICDSQGIIIARSHSSLTGDDVIGYLGVSTVLRTRETTTSIEQVLSNNGRLSLYASAPIFDNGILIGIVNCNYDLTNNEYVDIFKERTGCEATIFFEDIRISTTITDGFGRRIIGTHANDFISEEVLFHRREYVGNLDIYGRMYGVCYTPLISGGRTIGMLFTGVDIAHILQNQRSMNFWIIRAAFIAIIASIAFIIISGKTIGKVESASRAKSIFLSNMSHEMRTPMNAIIGMTTIARNSVDEERRKYALDKVEEASSHLLGIINDVLDMSKIEANKFDLSSVEFEVREILQKAVSFVRFNMETKKQKFSLNIEANVPVLLKGDDQRLTQVLTNLLSNAVKFTPEEGKIGLNVSLVRTEHNVSEVRFEVRDSGIGVSPENQKKIFRMFEQAESGTTRKFGGTGLGLSISRHIIELMGGSIHVESEAGKGSSFIFTVKMHAVKKDTIPIIEIKDKISVQEGEVYSGKKILLAEDIEINREILISLLEGTGLVIDTAENGIEALDKYKGNPGYYDLIFMDMQMPEMDGIEATKQIRKFEKDEVVFNKRIPIIAMTANVFKEDIESCIAAGMNDHIGKPLDINTVHEKLRKFLAK